MDLGTIRAKLKKKGYKTLFEVGNDVRLVWTNCMTYNADGSEFYKLADGLHRKWDDKYTKLLQECSPAVPAGGEGGGSAADHKPMASSSEASARVTLAEKRNFAKSLFAVSKEDLGCILVEVEAKCPAALTRNSAEDEVELNVDKLTPSLLAELNKFVDSRKAAGTGGGTGSKTSSNAKRQKT